MTQLPKVFALVSSSVSHKAGPQVSLAWTDALLCEHGVCELKGMATFIADVLPKVEQKSATATLVLLHSSSRHTHTHCHFSHKLRSCAIALCIFCKCLRALGHGIRMLLHSIAPLVSLGECLQRLWVLGTVVCGGMLVSPAESTGSVGLKQTNILEEACDGLGAVLSVSVKKITCA
eukprot:5919038-Amphidinium_carterae.1